MTTWDKRSTDVTRLTAAIEVVTQVAATARKAIVGPAPADPDDVVERGRRLRIERGRRAGLGANISTVELNRAARALAAGVGTDATDQIDAAADEAIQGLCTARSAWVDRDSAAPSLQALVFAAALAGVAPACRWPGLPDDAAAILDVAAGLGRLTRLEPDTPRFREVIEGYLALRVRRLSPADRDVVRRLGLAINAQLSGRPLDDPAALRLLAGLVRPARRLNLRTTLGLLVTRILCDFDKVDGLIAASEAEITATVPATRHLFSIARLVARNMREEIKADAEIPMRGPERANLARSLAALDAADDTCLRAMIQNVETVVVLPTDAEPMEIAGPIVLAREIVGSGRPTLPLV